MKVRDPPGVDCRYLPIGPEAGQPHLVMKERKPDYPFLRQMLWIWGRYLLSVGGAFLVGT